jgi:hypothetical protein
MVNIQADEGGWTMKRLFLFAAVVGATLIGAHPPQDSGRGSSHDENAYPPCSRTVRDSCIQRHERGVRRHHRGHDGAMAQHRGHASHVRMASRCAVRCAGHRRVAAARVRRAGERG